MLQVGARVVNRYQQSERSGTVVQIMKSGKHVVVQWDRGVLQRIAAGALLVVEESE